MRCAGPCSTAAARWPSGWSSSSLSIVGLALLPQPFVPESDDSSSSSLRSSCRPGVRLEQTAAASAAAYQILRRHPEVTDVVESIGEDEDGEVRMASLYVSW